MKIQIEEKIKTAFEKLKGNFSWSNVMQTPKIEKIVLSVGVGRDRKNKSKMELIEDRLKKITGQKPAFCKARKSIASFKLREGEVIGYKVTLRGKKMKTFFDKFINIALPRSKDFRGIKENSIDEMGNLTIGIDEHIIFPETPDEVHQDIFSLSMTITTSTHNKSETKEYLEHLGLPFAKTNK